MQVTRATAAPNISKPSNPQTQPALNSKVSRPPKLQAGNAVLLQGFGWQSSKAGNWYRHLTEIVPLIKSSGVTHLWLPPPSVSVSPEGYLPGQFYNLNSKYGTQDDLVALNAALLEASIRPVADIVINHRSADVQDENGLWNVYKDDVDHPGHKIDWGKWAITSDDPSYGGQGHKDTGADYNPSPDLDHTNEAVRQGIIEWLQWLKTYIGFVGWRLDFVKGYAAKYVKEYIENTVGLDEFCVGENWVDLKWNDSCLDRNQDKARQILVDWCKESHCGAFDFVTKGVLQEAVKNTEYDRLKDKEGKPPGLLGWWGERAVTFIDNHDTGSSQNHWPFPKKDVMQGYTYILTHPGVPTIFYEHYFDWGLDKEIQTLIDVRTRNGINASSNIEILAAEADMYVAKINDCVVVKLGPKFEMGKLVPDEKQGWKMACSGQNYAVWERFGKE